MFLKKIETGRGHRTSGQQLSNIDFCYGHPASRRNFVFRVRKRLEPSCGVRKPEVELCDCRGFIGARELGNVEK